MRKTLVYAGLVLLFGLALFGCSGNKSVNTTGGTDQSAVLALINGNADLTSSDVLSLTVPDTMALLKPASVQVDTVRFWWRQILHRGRLLGWGTLRPPDSSDTFPTLQVTLTDTLVGRFHILGVDSTNRIHVIKPFEETATRRVLFEKRGSDNDLFRGWVLTGVSDVELVSIPTVTAHLDSVRLQAPGLSHTVTASNVLDIILRKDLMSLHVGDTIHVTAFTGNATDSVFIHGWFAGNFIRQHLTNNGNGSFSGSWTVTGDVGRRHLVVDVIKSSVFTNDSAPYDSRQWGILYKVGVPE